MINSPLQFGISISARMLAEETGLASIPGAMIEVWNALYWDHQAPGEFQAFHGILEDHLEPLQQARARIARIDRQVALYRLNLDQYQVAPALTGLENLYRDYMQALDWFVLCLHEKAAGSLRGEEDRKAALNRLTDLGWRVAQEVGPNLQSLQRLLSTAYAPYFLRPFSEDLKQRDFVSFFYLSKYCYARFFLAQVKAYLLLHLVHVDNRLPFQITNETKDFETLLGRQEKEMTYWLAPQVLALVQELALEPQDVHGAAAVSFRSGLGDHGLSFGDDGGVHLSGRVQEWRLEPIESMAFNPYIDQRFRIRHAVSGKILQLGGPTGAMGVTDYKQAKGGWKISWSDAHKVFNLQFKGAADDINHDMRLVSRVGPNHASTEVRLDGKRVNHPYEFEQQFYLEPYNQPFAERERLLVGEHLTPGGYLTSDTGAYTLHFRHNGAVEVVKARDGKVVWSAGGGHPARPVRLMLQPDGNLVAYDIHGSPYWASGKYFKDQQALYKRSELRVRKDGRVEIRVPGQEIFWITPQ
ncbi:hypothetical protein V0R50_16465 [Pseudomonas sp. 148P]|uniref:Bulb-type lectin domain-containing protein n=1 Tax=Pseudomonas ulcerans TaxID=3115852 RepID=A0ABU7HTH2_9PSED|nr:MULTISPECIES: hypothetical protein [unclassified Pseudomonas]MEE1923301.1 hypothetical protein [Pseudomonas sp. 147P]MEE1934824.1 hypothetical protein [Pseudomonas sp. 148P]